MVPMGDPWFHALRHHAEAAALAAGSSYPPEVALFYLARWSQKESALPEPDVGSFDPTRLGDVAERIVTNLEAHGDTVERLVAGDRDRWSELRGLLLSSARSRVPERADEHADDAMGRVAEVLLTGTPPSRAPAELRAGLEGPGNEYVFTSPFPFWARSIVIHRIVDEQRREVRSRRPRPPRAAPGKPPVDRARLREARDALPGLIDAIRHLPRVQRSVLVGSLQRAEIEEEVRERLRDLAPDLFPTGESFASDRELAEALGTNAKLVAANRSAARRKLARRDRRWELLLDLLLPHRSTRPLAPATPEGGSDG